MRFPVRAKTIDELHRQANAQVPGQLEAFAHMLYDTQVFATATTSLSFFQSVQSNKSLGNLPTAGQIPDPNYFEIFGLCLDINSAVSVAGDGTTKGAIDDIYKILFGDAPTTGAEAGRITLNKNGKLYGPWPLSALHGTGGPVGFGWGTLTAEDSVQYANNGVFDGGFPVNGCITLAPREPFEWIMEWGGSITVTATAALRLSMLGVYHRKVS
jgi:hypothetical protein